MSARWRGWKDYCTMNASEVAAYILQKDVQKTLDEIFEYLDAMEDHGIEDYEMAMKVADWKIVLENLGPSISLGLLEKKEDCNG